MGELLTKAFELRDKARRALEHAIKTEYPIGHALRFESSHGRIDDATVLQHCYGDRIVIRNERTGKERAIYVYRIRS